MVIMGIDPGLASTGYGVIEKEGTRLKVLGYGDISTSSSKALSARLGKIYDEVMALLERYRPGLVVVEGLFLGANARSAMVVGQAKGVVCLAAWHRGLEVLEYTPLQVKKTLVGHGRAEKEQVKYMVRQILGLPGARFSSHAGDALALAVCHAHHEEMARRVERAKGGEGGSPSA
jgi:crossover junction endodeoxyribonuclease RuvC